MKVQLCGLNNKKLMFSLAILRETSRLSGNKITEEHCNWGHLDKAGLSDNRKITIYSKKVGCGLNRRSQENNKLIKAKNVNINSKHFQVANLLLDNILLSKTLDIQNFVLCTCNLFDFSANICHCHALQQHATSSKKCIQR